MYDIATCRAIIDLENVPGDLVTYPGWMEFSNDDQIFAAVDRPGVAYVWDVQTGERIAEFRGHKSGVNSIAFSRDGRALFTGGVDGTIRIWAVERAAYQLSGHLDEVTHAIWSPDGQLVATGSADETVRIWDARTGRRISILASQGRVSSMTFSSDSQRLLVAKLDGGGAQVWDARAGKVITSFTGRQTPHEALEHADWSPDEAIVIAEVEGDLLRWDAHSGQALSGIDSGQRSERSKRRLCGYSRISGMACQGTNSDTISRIWDVRTGSLISELKNHLHPMNEGVVSRDGRLIALSDFSGVVEVWETRTGQLKHRLDPDDEEAFIVSLNFDPSGTKLVTGGGQTDPVVKVWDLTTGNFYTSFAATFKLQRVFALAKMGS